MKFQINSFGPSLSLERKWTGSLDAGRFVDPAWVPGRWMSGD